MFSQKNQQINTTRNYSFLTYGACGNVQNGPKSLYLANFQPPNLLKSPLYYQWSTSNSSYSPKILHKLVLPENIIISYFCGMENHKMYPKVVYLVILTYFRTPTHKIAPYTTTEVHLGAHISPKSLHKFVLPENISISHFCGKEKMCPKVGYLVILTHFRTP